MDIVVTLPKDRGGIVHLGDKAVAHKYNEVPYWEMNISAPSWNRPTKLKKGNKVFICTEGYVRGFFIFKDIDWNFHESFEEIKKHLDSELIFLNFEYNSWQPINPIKMKGFQGFRYRKFDYEETNN